MKQYKRSTRVGEQILKDVSQLLEVELAENLGGMITFTHCRLSSDMRYATIYYSVLGTDEDEQMAAGYLLRERKRIRHDISKGLQLRHIPELSFKFDPSVKEGLKIERLLNEIKSDTKE